MMTTRPKDAHVSPDHVAPVLPRLLDVDGLSRYLSMPKGTIYTYVSTGRIPRECIRHIGRALRFDVAAIDRWVDGQQAPAAAGGMVGTGTLY